MEQQTARVLQKLNLNLGLELTQQIFWEAGCLEEDQGCGLEELEVVAIAALVVCGKRLLAVDQRTLVGTGIPLQAFLSSVSLEKRPSLLHSIDRLARKYFSQSPLLNQKISKIATAYSLYAHFTPLFAKLSAASNFSTGLNSTLANIFWLAYLNNNNYLATTQDQLKEQLNLCQYLLWVFETFFATLSREQILKALQQQAIQRERLNKAQFQVFTRKVLENFNSVCAYRQMSLKALPLKVQEETFAELFLEDYCYLSQQEKDPASPHYISFTLFFSRNPLLAPRPRHRLLIPQHANLGIVARIHFQQDGQQQQQMEQVLAETPTQNRFQMAELNRAEHTQYVLIQNSQQENPANQSSLSQELLALPNICRPVKERAKALSWVQRAIQNSQQSAKQILEPLFRDLLNEDLQQFIKIQQKVVQRISSKFFPTCRDIPARAKKSVSVFLSILTDLAQNPKDQQVKKLFSSIRKINGFLFISTLLVLYAYKAEQIQLKDCMEQLGIGCQEAFEGVNWVRENCYLPKQMKWWMGQVQTELLLKLIWSQGTGCKLFEQLRNKQRTNLQSTMLRRMQKQVNMRISSLCGENTELKLKVWSIICHIEERELEILRKNSINSLLLAATIVATKILGQKSGLSDSTERILSNWFKLPRAFPQQIVCFEKTGTSLNFSDFLKMITEFCWAGKEESQSSFLAYGTISEDSEMVSEE